MIGDEVSLAPRWDFVLIVSPQEKFARGDELERIEANRRRYLVGDRPR